MPGAPSFVLSKGWGGRFLRCRRAMISGGVQGRKSPPLHKAQGWGTRRPVTIDGIGVTYDALGDMVEQDKSGAYSQFAYSTTGVKLGILGGQSWQTIYVPLVGGSTELIQGSGNSYTHFDWLGNTRLITTPSQTVAGDVTYAPFGETYASNGIPFISFTGMGQDTEPVNPATLYDFPAREYGTQGRWPSPDPAGIDAVDPTNPQSWNRYAYALNNPLAMVDPTGMEGGLFPCFDPVSCILENVIGVVVLEILEFLLESPPPQAAPAPPGGYGGGIDPYGTWNEEVPAGVQVFPSSVTGIPNGSGCTYGSGHCGGGVYGFQVISKDPVRGAGRSRKLLIQILVLGESHRDPVYDCGQPSGT